ncbi:MAG: NAD-dependent epimerase/dehydratase family protein [Pseudomonadota bacterium]
MRAFVTGGTGFVGGALARALRERGDDVVALVRAPATADHLRHLGCTLVPGDLDDPDAIRRGLEGADAVFHAAAVYRIGVTAAEADAMERTNVDGTERVLGLAREAGVERAVHVSTVNVFGNTRGEVVDERRERPRDDFLSAYDRTKYLAHLAARECGARIAQPGAVYGPGDTSQLGDQIGLAMRGKLPYLSFPSLGVNAVHVDDVAQGLLLVHDRGRPRESYVLGGELTTMRALITTAARVAGKRPPRVTLPTAAVRAIAPLGSLLRPLGLPPNLHEVIAASDGVTYWATDARARGELGYAPRALEDGLLDLYAAEHAPHRAHGDARTPL